jgi:hypothetical protein
LRPIDRRKNADGTKLPAACFLAQGRTKRLSCKWSNDMKSLLSLFLFALAVAIAAPAFAGDVTKATTEAECTEAGGTWDADASTCSAKE